MARFAFRQSAHDPSEVEKYLEQEREVRAGRHGKLGSVHQEALDDLNKGRTRRVEIDPEGAPGFKPWVHSKGDKFHHFVHPDIVNALVKTGKVQVMDSELYPTKGKAS